MIIIVVAVTYDQYVPGTAEITKHYAPGTC